MPSLVPIKYDAPDLKAVFESEKTAESCRRVINFLKNFVEKFSDAPENLFREHSYCEQFCLTMPTEAAFDSEIRLCEAIISHSADLMTDVQIKAVLDEFLAFHTFCYLPDGVRVTKSGDCKKWLKSADLYLLTSDKNSFVCNPVQTWLVSKIYTEKFKAVKL